MNRIVFLSIQRIDMNGLADGWMDGSNKAAQTGQRTFYHLMCVCVCVRKRRREVVVNGKSDYSYLIYDQCKWLFDVSHLAHVNSEYPQLYVIILELISSDER